MLLSRCGDPVLLGRGDLGASSRSSKFPVGAAGKESGEEVRLGMEISSSRNCCPSRGESKGCSRLLQGGLTFQDGDSPHRDAGEEQPARPSSSHWAGSWVPSPSQDQPQAKLTQPRVAAEPETCTQG